MSGDKTQPLDLDAAEKAWAKYTEPKLSFLDGEAAYAVLKEEIPKAFAELRALRSPRPPLTRIRLDTDNWHRTEIIIDPVEFARAKAPEAFSEARLNELFAKHADYLIGKLNGSPRPSLEADAGIIALLRAGNLMGNLCYNGAQSEKVPEEYRKSMRECVAEWDAARERFRTPAPSLVSPPPDPCEWKGSDPEYGGEWNTACGHAWCFTEDGPVENGVKFCFCCGKPVKAIPYRPESDEDDSEGESDGRGPA